MGNLETEATQLASDLKMEILRRKEDNKEQYMRGIKEEKMIIRHDNDAPTKSMEFAQLMGDESSMKALQHISKGQEKYIHRLTVQEKKFVSELQRKGPNLWTFLKRGMIGVDAYVLGFAILGTLLIPLYFYRK